MHTMKTSTLQIYACDENCPSSLWDSKTRLQPLVLAAADCRAPFWVLCVICLDIYIYICIYIHVCVSVNVHLYSALQLRVDSHMLIALGEDDGERDEGRGLWEKG